MKSLEEDFLLGFSIDVLDEGGETGGSQHHVLLKGGKGNIDVILTEVSVEVPVY